MAPATLFASADVGLIARSVEPMSQVRVAAMLATLALWLNLPGMYLPRATRRGDRIGGDE
jgi:hypothetical protein